MANGAYKLFSGRLVHYDAASHRYRVEFTDGEWWDHDRVG